VAYCTREDIEKDLPKADLIQLTDDEGAVTGEDDSDETQVELRVSEAIAKGDAVIDGYLRSRNVTLPLTSVPKLINTLSVDLAIWGLYKRRISQEMPQTIADRYKNAINLLQQIQAGKLGWGDGTTAPAVPAEYRTDMQKRDRLFPKRVLDKF